MKTYIKILFFGIIIYCIASFMMGTFNPSDMDMEAKGCCVAVFILGTMFIVFADDYNEE